MIDLHVHLDGSLTPEQVFALGKLQGVKLPGESPAQLEPFLTASPDCESLNMYLRCFSLPVRVLQTWLHRWRSRAWSMGKSVLPPSSTEKRG